MGAVGRADAVAPIACARCRHCRTAPEDERAALIPAGWFDSWAEATLAIDPASPRPGAIQAVRDHWRAGRPLHESSAIACPVLPLRGEWHLDGHHATARSLFAALTGPPYRRFVEIGEATHMLLSDQNRRQCLDAVVAVLKESAAPET